MEIKESELRKGYAKGLSTGEMSRFWTNFDHNLYARLSNVKRIIL